MRQFVSILSVAMILVGVGSILQSPADTVTIPVTAAVAPDAQTIADEPAANEADSQLASWKAPRAGGGCSTCGPQACAPTVEKTVKVEKKIAKTKTVEVTEKATESGRRHIVAGVTVKAGKCVRAVFHRRRCGRGGC
jgi:hypothetical protein